MTTAAPFDWLSYLGVADRLVAEPGEAFARSAVSRAYYAAFASARRTLERRQGVPLANRGVHKRVTELLLNDTDARLRQLGLDLGRLKGERERADYDASERFPRKRADMAIAMARAILAVLPSS